MLLLQILKAVDVLQQQGWEYQLEASYVEVYNETLRDLLATGNSKRDGAKLLDASAIKHDAAGGCPLVGLAVAACSKSLSIPALSAPRHTVPRLNDLIKDVPACTGGSTTVAGALRVQVASAADADELISRAATARAVDSTAMNAASSRSHSIFMLYIIGTHACTGTRLQGALNLVDLAGRYVRRPGSCRRPCVVSSCAHGCKLPCIIWH